MSAGEHGEQGRVAPTVSIGLAVYNGEQYLEQAIVSILEQTFGDFELLVSDNASTDRTPEIARRYCELDARVRYHRNPANIGGARNENLTVRMTSGRYFRWAAHDDYLEPQLLERCVDVLERHSDVVLAFTQVRQLNMFDGSEHVVSRNKADATRPATRFRRMIMSRDLLEETYGLVRRDVLERTDLQADYTDSDRTLMAELSLYGRFHEIAEPLFVKRIHARNAYVDWRTRIAWFRPDLEQTISFPWWAQLADLVSTVRHVEAPAPVRLECAATVVWWAIVNSPRLAKDLVVAAYFVVRGRRWRRERFAATRNWD